MSPLQLINNNDCRGPGANHSLEKGTNCAPTSYEITWIAKESGWTSGHYILPLGIGAAMVLNINILDQMRKCMCSGYIQCLAKVSF